MGITDLAHRLFKSNHSVTPENTRIYVIGDIHGRCDLLEKLHGKITQDIQANDDVQYIKQIFLGDYIDRGDQSKQVIEFLIQNTDQQVERIFLKGNHEAIFLKFLSDANILSSWQNFGGLETLRSYGVNLACLNMSGGFESARQQLSNIIPQSHLEFFQSLKTHMIFGDYFFCHAGVRPGISLEDQKEEDLLWIREEFLENNTDHGKIIVHGHTPVDQPEIWKNRINIDTGAYITNKLTCLILEGECKRCL